MHESMSDVILRPCWLWSRRRVVRVCPHLVPRLPQDARTQRWAATAVSRFNPFWRQQQQQQVAVVAVVAQFAVVAVCCRCYLLAMPFKALRARHSAPPARRHQRRTTYSRLLLVTHHVGPFLDASKVHVKQLPHEPQELWKISLVPVPLHAALLRGDAAEDPRELSSILVA